MEDLLAMVTSPENIGPLQVTVGILLFAVSGVLFPMHKGFGNWLVAFALAFVLYVCFCQFTTP